MFKFSMYSVIIQWHVFELFDMQYFTFSILYQSHKFRILPIIFCFVLRYVACKTCQLYLCYIWWKRLSETFRIYNK